MTTVTSFALTSPLTQGAAPVAVGQGFKKGDVPAGQYLTTDQSGLSCIPLATWNDGSLKHARIVGTVPLTANAPLTVNLSAIASAPVGTALTSASITTVNPSASVQCGSLGTVNLAALLGHEVRTVASTPNMVECHYRAPVAGTNLLVWFYVRLFANNAVFIRAAIEQGYLDNGSGGIATNADVVYIPTVTIGGNVVYNNGGTSLTHCRNTRWKADGWIGTDPQITPAHNTAYLRSTKLVPNYALSTASDTMLNSYTGTYTPMSTGGIPAYMPATGSNPTIALLPEWDAAYLGTADPRAYRAVLAASHALNSFPICWRDFTTKDIVKPNSFPTWSFNGAGGSNGRGPADGSNGTTWEINHHPNIGYTAYLLTGDYWHYETMLLQLSCMWIARGIMSINDPNHGSGTQRVLAHEVRGGAWAIRTMSSVCGLMPDSEKVSGKPALEYRDLLANNMIYWKSLVDTPGINQLGYLYEYSGNGQGLYGYGPGMVAPWQHNWWAQAQGFGSELDPLPDMTIYNAVRDYTYKGIVGMLGPVGTGYAFDCASSYTATISSGTDLNPTTWYSDWLSVYNATFASANGSGPSSIPHNNTLLSVGDMSKSPPDPVPYNGGAGMVSDAQEGRWGYLLPAIAYAVDHGAPGAAASWARIIGASNYSTLTGAFTNQSSQWGVFPRTLGVATVTHAIGPSIRFGRLRSGRITISKYHGNGIPAFAIPTGFPQPALLLNDVDSVNDPAGTLYRLEMPVPTTSTGTAAPFKLNEDSSFSIVGAADGTYTSTQSVYKNGVLAYTEPFSAGIGAAAPTVTMVTVSPLTPSVTGGATQQFAAAVVGTNSPAQTVTWTTTGGTINSSGLLTAPAATSAAQTITVRATSTVDATKSGAATVTVPAVVAAPTPTVSSVTVSPTTANVSGGATQQFSAAVVGSNSPAQTVTWSVTGGGSINTSGLFTAPAATNTAQTITVTARSTVDVTKSGTVTITVAAVVVQTPTVTSVTISPSMASLVGGTQQQFTATVSGTNNPSQAVTWLLTGGGSVDATGLVTTPAATNTVQTLTLKATSVADTSKSATMVLIVPVAAPVVTGITISPPSLSLNSGSSHVFAAAVQGANSPSQSVNFTTTAGSIGADGTFIAPRVTTGQVQVTITATSTANSLFSASAVVTVMASAATNATTVNVTVLAHDQKGNPISGAEITLSLNQVDIDPLFGYIMPEEITVTADINGVAVVPMWPNSRGSMGSQYVVQILNPDTDAAMVVYATIPERDCYLHDVADMPTVN